MNKFSIHKNKTEKNILMKQKILFIGYSKKEKNNLVPRGIDVRCYSFAKYLDNNKYNTEVINSNKYEILPGIFGKMSICVGIFFRVLKENNKTVLYVQKPGLTSMITRIACLFKKNILILDIDDYEFESRIERFFFKSILNRSKCVICANEFLISETKKYTKKNCYYIPGGVETDTITFKNKYNKNSKVKIVWAGNILKESCENIKKMLDLFKIVFEKNKNITLEIRGDGSHLKYIEEKIKKEKIINVKIVGRQKDFSKYLSGIDIGVVYLFDNKYDNSKSPGKVYTYLAAGLPIIGTNVGENKKAIINGRNGYLTKNDKEFVDRTLFLAKNYEIREKFGRNSRDIAIKVFDRKKIVEKLSKILSEELKC
jgi:glycosyltransferase involved in cell wall biosynthesis